MSHFCEDKEIKLLKKTLVVLRRKIGDFFKKCVLISIFNLFLTNFGT